MYLDETQALDISLDTEDENDSLCYKKQVASLIIIACSDANEETSFSIYNGINKIGRNSDFEITMNSKFISRHHCTIEYSNSNHLIFDCSSTNKTKKNKIFLIPEVRYELRDGDILKFGDINCEYKFTTSIVKANKVEMGTKVPLQNNNLKHILDVESYNIGDSGETVHGCSNDSIISEDLLTKTNSKDASNFNNLTSVVGDKINLALDISETIPSESSYNHLEGCFNIVKNVREHIVPETQMDSQITPKRIDFFSDANISFDTPVRTETFHENIIGNTIYSLKKEGSPMSPDFAHETQDMDEVVISKRKMADSGSCFITEVPDTPEKDQFECCTPIVQASNLKTESKWDSSIYERDHMHNFESGKNLNPTDNEKFESSIRHITTCVDYTNEDEVLEIDKLIFNEALNKANLHIGNFGISCQVINREIPNVDENEFGFEHVESYSQSTQHKQIDMAGVKESRKIQIQKVPQSYIDNRSDNLTVETQVDDEIALSNFCLNEKKIEFPMMSKDITDEKEYKYSSGESSNKEFLLREYLVTSGVSSNLFPKSYAHKNKISFDKNSKQNKIANFSLNYFGKIGTSSKRNSKKIASAKLLSRCTSIHRKTLFGSINDEFELKYEGNLFDTFSGRRKSKEETVKEEALNAKDIQSMVTDNLSTSPFKKKLEVDKKLSKKRTFKSNIHFLKFYSNCDVSDFKCENIKADKRMSYRTNKGEKLSDPNLITFNYEKEFENIEVDGCLGTTNMNSLTIGLSEIDSKEQDFKEDNLSNYITKKTIGDNRETKVTIDQKDLSHGLKLNQGRINNNEISLNVDSASASKYPPVIYCDKNIDIITENKLKDLHQHFDSIDVRKIRGKSMEKLLLNIGEEISNKKNIKPTSEEFKVQILDQSESKAISNDKLSAKLSNILTVDSVYNKLNILSYSQSTLMFKNDLLKQDNEKVELSFMHDDNDDVPSHHVIEDNFRNHGNESNKISKQEKREHDIQVDYNDMNMAEIKVIKKSIRKGNISEIKEEKELKRSTRSTLNEDFVRKVSDSNQSTRNNDKPKILFTGMKEEDALKTLKKLGGEEADSILECTHIISDQVRRTIKFMCGMAKGIPIVSLEWLKECKKQKKFIDAYPYLIKDVENESKFNFNLKETLKYSSSRKLFDGLNFHITKNVKPEPSEMKEIIICAAGKIIESMPRNYLDKLIVVSCADDLKSCKHLDLLGIPIVSSEFVMTGVLRHVVDIQCFRLSQNELETSQKSELRTQSKRRKLL